jgi:O-antigen ligase
MMDDWGRSYYTGVTLDKNMFGYLLFAYGLFFTAGLVSAFRQKSLNPKSRRADIAAWGLLLAMIGWLTPLANSKTSLLSLITGIVVVIALQFAKVRRHLWSFLITTVILGAIANSLFSVRGEVLEAAGRDASMTGRTGIWETVLSQPNDPILGTGYASFWLGERLERIWKKYPNTPLLQAHNGYLEMYINLGVVGLVLLACVLWTGLRNARRRLTPTVATGNLDENVFQTFGMAYVLAYLIYNITEATFIGLNFLFIVFLLLACEYKRARSRPNNSSPQPASGRRPAMA